MSIEAPEAPVTDTPPETAQPATPAAPAPAPPAPPAQQPAAPAPAESAKPKAPPEPDWKAEAEAAKSERDKLRAEAERWKQQSRAQETRSKNNHKELQNRDAILREIAAKVGVDFDDKPDPEELTRKLGEAQATAKQRSVELAVYTTAAQSGANAAALLDSREFMAKTAMLDPEAVDFSGQVGDLVSAAAQQSRYAIPAPAVPAPATDHQPSDNYQQPPQQRAAPQPPASTSGADFSGAPGGDGMWTQSDYDNYMATSHAHDRDGAKLSKAIAEGRLANLGIGRTKGRNRR